MSTKVGQQVGKRIRFSSGTNPIVAQMFYFVKSDFPSVHLYLLPLFGCVDVAKGAQVGVKGGNVTHPHMGEKRDNAPEMIGPETSTRQPASGTHNPTGL